MITSTSIQAKLPLASTLPAPGSFYRWTARQIIGALQAAGLEVVDPSPMTGLGSGPAPISAQEGINFLIPSLCSDCGGRVYAFSNPSDLNSMQSFLVSTGQQARTYFSWVYVRDNILIQIDGNLPEARASQYDKALENLK